MRFLKHLEEKLSNISVYYSLRIIFCFFCLIPVILLSLTYLTFVYKTMLGWEEEKVSASLYQSSNIFTKYLEDVKEFSDKIYINKQVKKILETDYSDIQQVYADYSSINYLVDSLVNYNIVESFKIYTENYSLLDNSFIVKAPEKIINTQWYKNAIELKGQGFLQLMSDPITQKEYMCFIRSIWEKDQSLGVLVINFNLNNSKYAVVKLPYDYVFFSGNDYIYGIIENVSPEEKKLLMNICASYDFEKNNIEKKVFRNEKIAIKGLAFSVAPYSDVEFKVLFLIPLYHLNKATFKMLIFAIFILCLIILFVYLVLRHYLAYIKARFKKIQKGIDNVVSNKFEIESSIGGNDEFENVYQALYKMAEDTKKLIQKVYIQDLEYHKILSKQNEMNFKMLCSQINPHFLFNTLESIRMKALSSNDKDTAKMLRLLASLLRYNLSLKDEPVPLVQEIEIIESYLKIQKMRFGERIKYKIENLCEESEKILPLLIQPVIENSVKYALENNENGGNLSIKACNEVIDSKRFLIIEIKDDGPGIQESKLNELNSNFANFDEYLKNLNENKIINDVSEKPQSINSDTMISYKSKSVLHGTSIGLENVNSRIKLFYGISSGLIISSVKNEGTVVRLKIENKAR